MDTPQVGAGALANNLSLLPLLFDSTSASSGSPDSPFGSTTTDPFAAVVQQAESGPLVNQSFLSNLTNGHSVLASAAPLLAPGAFLSGTPGASSPQTLAGEVSTFVKALDQALQATGTAAGSPFGNLPGLLQNNSSALSAIGITTDATGMLTVDTPQLASALQNSPGTVRSLLQGPGGLAQAASTAARALIQQTLGLPGGNAGGLTSGILGSSLGLLLNVQA